MEVEGRAGRHLGVLQLGIVLGVLEQEGSVCVEGGEGHVAQRVAHHEVDLRVEPCLDRVRARVRARVRVRVRVGVRVDLGVGRRLDRVRVRVRAGLIWVLGGALRLSGFWYTKLPRAASSSGASSS